MFLKNINLDSKRVRSLHWICISDHFDPGYVSLHLVLKSPHCKSAFPFFLLNDTFVNMFVLLLNTDLCCNAALSDLSTETSVDLPNRQGPGHVIILLAYLFPGLRHQPAERDTSDLFKGNWRVFLFVAESCSVLSDEAVHSHFGLTPH